jgi:stage II sporulation protein D
MNHSYAVKILSWCVTLAVCIQCTQYPARATHSNRPHPSAKKQVSQQSKDPAGDFLGRADPYTAKKGARESGFYFDGEHFKSPTRYVRVVLSQNSTNEQVALGGVFDVKARGMAEPVSVRGGLSVRGAGGGIILDMSDLGRRTVALPCTLLSKNEFSIFRALSASFRGSVIIEQDQHGSFMLVNYLDVEDYLRGVVPLEVGRGRDDIVEAVEAQAVAARTYTYKKMSEHQADPFDLVATVADQAYGGVSAESEACNRAIRMTAQQVMVNGDSLIYAYYHSTCGGKTANIEDVWNKAPVPYLRSVDDADWHGGAYCVSSGSYTWEEQWPLSQFSSIVNRYSKETFPQNQCTGDVRSVTVDSKFRCGRVRQCTVHTSTGDFSYGGDKLRFIFRRNAPGWPILKSCLITSVSVASSTLTIQGKGYGHGVGMCQSGAMARARDGQSFKDILKAYYKDIRLVLVEIDAKGKK